MKRHDEVLFSILVPVYNVEIFLSECIESALNQTYNNFEIILVDDGSTDASDVICDEYASAHRNISVYHTQNRGQIHAREFAMRHASGDFFVFLDADDRLCSNALETIAATINKHRCDCVIFGFSKLINGVVVPVLNDEKEEVLTNKRDIYRKGLFGNDGTKYNSMCTKAVKASVCNTVIDDTELLQIRLGEDLIQSLTVFKNSERIAFIKDSLYEYRDNQNSISYTVTYDDYKKSVIVHELVYQFLKREQVFNVQDFEEFRQTCLEKHVAALLRICNLKATTYEKVQLMRSLKNTDYYRDFVNRGPTKSLVFRRRVLFLLNRWKLDYVIVIFAAIYTKWL